MKYLTIIMLGIFSFAFAQTPAPKPPVPKPPEALDSEMASIIAKVESGPREMKVEMKYQPETDLEKVVTKRAESFVRALIEDDFKTTYDMMWTGYKKVITLPKYMGKKRLTLSKASVTNIIVTGNSCAELRGYLYGAEGGSSLGSLRIPFREYFFIEDNEWRIYKNPYETSMGIMHPMGRKMKNPCRPDKK